VLVKKPDPRPPLNALLVDYWDAQLGVGLTSGAVSTWTGQKLGVVATAPGSQYEPYAPDVAFRRKPSLQTVESGALQLRNDNTGAAMAAAGSRPYTISAWHWIGAPIASLKTILMIGNIAAGGSNQFGHYVGVTNDVITCSYNGATAAATISGVGTKNHITEFWADGTNLNVRDNGVLAATASAVTLTSAGISWRDGSHPGNRAAVFHALFSAKPSDAYIAQLVNWIRERYL